LGRYAIVTARVNGLLLKVKTRGQLKITEGESVWLDFDLNRLYFFDTKIRTSITIW